MVIGFVNQPFFSLHGAYLAEFLGAIYHSYEFTVRPASLLPIFFRNTLTT
jgi:hypothetical protein